MIVKFEVRAENPEAQLWDIGKMIGQLWRDATDADRAIYQHEYEIEKVKDSGYFQEVLDQHSQHHTSLKRFSEKGTVAKFA